MELNHEEDDKKTSVGLRLISLPENESREEKELFSNDVTPTVSSEESAITSSRLNLPMNPSQKLADPPTNVKSMASGSRNWYQCRRCRYHGQFVFLAGGHHQVCPYRDCRCQACSYVSKDTERAGERMRQWRKFKRTAGKQRTPNIQNKKKARHTGVPESDTKIEHVEKQWQNLEHPSADIPYTTSADSSLTAKTAPALPKHYRSASTANAALESIICGKIQSAASSPGLVPSSSVSLSGVASSNNASLASVCTELPSASLPAPSNRQLFVQNMLSSPPVTPLAEQRRKKNATASSSRMAAVEIKEESTSPDLCSVRDPQEISNQHSEDSDVQGSTDSFASSSSHRAIDVNKQAASMLATSNEHIVFSLANRDCLVHLMNLAQEVRGASFILKSDGEIRLVSESEEKSVKLIDLGQTVRIIIEALPKRTDSEWPKAGGWAGFIMFVRTLLITLFDICSTV